MWVCKGTHLLCYAKPTPLINRPTTKLKSYFEVSVRHCLPIFRFASIVNLGLNTGENVIRNVFSVQQKSCKQLKF